MSRKKNINLTIQPLDNLRLTASIRDERLEEFLRITRRVRRAIRWANKLGRAKR